ncbi:MAG: glycosyl hydrolase family 28-related protein [Bacteroidota bacterium]
MNIYSYDFFRKGIRYRSLWRGSLIAVALIFSITLACGQGRVGINTDKPTATLDVNGNLRIREFAAKGKVLVSDSTGIGKWAFLPNGSGLSITQFGAIPNDAGDDTDAILLAIDSAAHSGGRITIPVGVFTFSRPLVLPDGVYLEGLGRGADPLESPTNGSVLQYKGEGWAVLVEGHHAGIRNLTLSEAKPGQGANGILISATNRLLESIFFEQVHIYGFSSGTAMELAAKNSGGIAYGSFQQIRIRHGKIGLSIKEDETSFVNSNFFQKVVVSGGGFDTGILIDGGNNNVFTASIIEPYESEVAHLAIISGQISAYDLRIEGRDQGNVRPLIKVNAGTFNNLIEGVFSGGIIEDKGANSIRMISSQNIQVESSGENMLTNSVFKGIENNLIPAWSITGAVSSIEIDEEQLVPGHNVLKVVVPVGEIAVFAPILTELPRPSGLHNTDFCSMGIYGKTDVEGAIQMIFNDFNGDKQSVGHTGNNDWEVIGMTGKTPVNAPPFPRIRLINSLGNKELVCYITTPTFTFGNKLPEIRGKAIRQNGGKLYGTLSNNITNYQIPSDNRLLLPATGNIFVLSGSHDIHRINDLAEDRFPAGCVITILFNDAGVKLQQIGFLFLVRDFISTANSSITLLSMGNGTWKEINRNL